MAAFTSPNNDDVTTMTQQLRASARCVNVNGDTFVTANNALITPSVKSQPNYKRTESFTDVINSRYTF